MAKSKPLSIVLVISVALATFFMITIWPFISVPDDPYKGKALPAASKLAQTEEASSEEAVLVEDSNQEMDSSETAEPLNIAEEEMVDTIVDNVETVKDETAKHSDMASTMTHDASETITDTVEAATSDRKEALVAATTALASKAEEATTQIEQATNEVVEPSSQEVSGEAEIHIVTAEGLKYAPLVIEIAVGDTVAWENMSSHDTQSIEGLIPAGAEMWHSGMGENYQRTFTQEGIYIYKCTPHFGAGMGGVIIVGNPVNLDEMKAAEVKGAAKRLVKKAIKAAEAA
jgi:pseudoazurin